MGEKEIASLLSAFKVLSLNQSVAANVNSPEQANGVIVEENINTVQSVVNACAGKLIY